MKHTKKFKKLTLNKQTIATVNGEELKQVRGGAAAWTLEGNCSGGCTENDLCGDSGSTICNVFKTFSVCIIRYEVEA